MLLRMSSRLIINKVVSFLFLIVLFIPLFFLIVTKQNYISKTEKRRLASFPELTFSYKSIKEYPKKFAVFFEDHFGFRSTIIGLHNYVYCKVLGISPSRAVIAGKKGWYYLNVDGAVSDYLGRVHYENLTLARMENVLEDRKEWLDMQGIKYLFLPVPNKEMIYGEFLPDILVKNKGENKYDQIVSFLGKSNFSDYIDSQKVLLKHKKDEKLYFQTDSHWNAIGAFIFYQELIRRLQQWFPEMEPLEEVRVQRWRPGGSGDLAVFMNVYGKLTESVPEMPAVLHCHPSREQRMKEMKNILKYRDIPDRKLPVKSGCDSMKRKVIVIHDSFGNRLKPYLNQSFKEVIYVHYLSFAVAKELIKQERPDVVIDIRVARNIEKALVLDHDLEQLVLGHKFPKLNDIVYLYALKKQRDIGDGRKKGRGEQSLSDTDDSVRFPLVFEGSSLEKMALKLSITSKEDMAVRCCYTSNHNAGKGDSVRQCQMRNLKTGDNQLFIRVLNPSNHGVFWVTPKKEEMRGKYVIRKMIAKREV